MKSHLICLSMNRFFLKYLFLIFLFPFPTSAYNPKEGNISSVFAVTSSRSHFESGRTGVNAKEYSGPALIVQGDINSEGNLEIGAFWMTKEFFRDEGENYLLEKSQFIHISMGYRHWFKSWLSSGLSFYSAYSIGNPEIVDSRNVSGPGLTSSARDKTEYGFDFSIQTEIFESGRYGMIFDTKYSYSVTGKKDEYPHHYLFLLGLRYFIQEKQIIQRPSTAM